jgi:hypothetical protein
MMPPYAWTVAAGVICAVSAVCIVMSRSASKQQGAVPINPAFLKFIGEQDGPREKTLKSALIRFFHNERIVQKAYLARLDIGEGRTVGLCLKASPPPATSYPDRLAELFIEVMGPGGSMDVLFLEGDQEEALAQVCKPFYEASKTT